MHYTVYILYSKSYKKTYVGFTSNLEERFKSHNELGVRGWTTRFRPWILVYTEEYESKPEAMGREKYYKTGKGREQIKKILSEQGLISA
jgi:putative endonuclease